MTSPLTSPQTLSRTTRNAGFAQRGPMFKSVFESRKTKEVNHVRTALTRFHRDTRSSRPEQRPSVEIMDQAPPRETSALFWLQCGLLLVCILHAGPAIAQSSLSDVVGIPT